MTDTTQPHPEPSQEASSLPVVAAEYQHKYDGFRYVSNAVAFETLPKARALTYLDVAQSQLTALRTQLQEQALQYLSDNGQWIEETGRLRTERDEALARIKAIEGDSANVARGSAFICPKCGIDRFKASCPDVWNCGIKITASMAPKETP